METGCLLTMKPSFRGFRRRSIMAPASPAQNLLRACLPATAGRYARTPLRRIPTGNDRSPRKPEFRTEQENRRCARIPEGGRTRGERPHSKNCPAGNVDRFHRGQGLPQSIETVLILEYGKEHKEMARDRRVRSRLGRKIVAFRLKIRPEGRWKWHFSGFPEYRQIGRAHV